MPEQLEPNVILVADADGFVAEIYPAKTRFMSLRQIAEKCVPDGTPFLLAHTNDLPKDRTYQGAWKADFSQPDGYGKAPLPYIRDE